MDERMSTIFIFFWRKWPIVENFVWFYWHRAKTIERRERISSHSMLIGSLGKNSGRMNHWHRLCLFAQFLQANIFSSKMIKRREMNLLPICLRWIVVYLQQISSSSSSFSYHHRMSLNAVMKRMKQVIYMAWLSISIQVTVNFFCY